MLRLLRFRLSSSTIQVVIDVKILFNYFQGSRDALESFAARLVAQIARKGDHFIPNISRGISYTSGSSSDDSLQKKR